MNKDEVKSELFIIGMWWRIFYGATRLVLGLALLKVINVPISDLLYKFTGSELAEDPTDFLFTTINSLLEAHPLSITYFLSSYLIFWGTVEIVLSISLLRHKIWAFPVTLWLIGGFMIYVIHRYTITHSPILVGVFLIDVLIFWLIYSEYKKMKDHPHFSSNEMTDKTTEEYSATQTTK